MKHLTCLLLASLLLACQNGPETNMKGDRVHLVVNNATVDQGGWDKVALPMIWWIDIHMDEALYQKATKEFTREQVISYAARSYLNDVVKEGHQWFFSNTAAVIQQDVLAGLKAIGLAKHVDIYQRALQKFEQTKGAEADFTEEDTGIILLRENEDVEKFFRNYVKANQDKFYYDQWVKKPDR